MNKHIATLIPEYKLALHRKKRMGKKAKYVLSIAV